MKLKTVFLLTLVAAAGCFFGHAAFADSDTGGRAKLWLSSDSSNYLSDSEDPWYNDSWVTHQGNFNLNVTNTLKSGSISLGNLVLAIPHNTADNGWSFTLGNQNFNYASFTGTGRHPYLSPHGVFSDNGGALWAQFDLGTIGAGETLSLPFSLTGAQHGFLLHFDAFGSSDPSVQNGWYFSPYSHDVTVTPEPVSSILFLTGGLALGMRRLIRKRREHPAK